jgi:hypothetical protein
MQTAAARTALHARQSANRIKTLQQQLNAYQTNLHKAQDHIQERIKQFAITMRDQSSKDSTQTPSERIYLDIIRNHGRDSHARRYCIETLAWAEEMHAISPKALEVVGKVISVPSEALLSSKFAQNRRIFIQSPPFPEGATHFCPESSDVFPCVDGW